MDRETIDRNWLESKSIPGITFALNEPVDIIAGEHAGQSGCTMTVLGMKPEPTYLVELRLRIRRHCRAVRASKCEAEIADG